MMVVVVVALMFVLAALSLSPLLGLAFPTAHFCPFVSVQLWRALVLSLESRDKRETCCHARPIILETRAFALR